MSCAVAPAIINHKNLAPLTKKGEAEQQQRDYIRLRVRSAFPSPSFFFRTRKDQVFDLFFSFHDCIPRGSATIFELK